MSRIGGRKAFDLEWVERWARQVNDDRRLPVIGRRRHNLTPRRGLCYFFARRRLYDRRAAIFSFRVASICARRL